MLRIGLFLRLLRSRVELNTQGSRNVACSRSQPGQCSSRGIAEDRMMFIQNAETKGFKTRYRKNEQQR